jgi:hypothetical protein
MHLRFFLVLLLTSVAIASTVLGQSAVQFPVEIKSPDYYSIQKDSAGNWGVFLKNLDSYEFLLVDSKGKVLKKKTISRKKEKLSDEKEYVGGTYTNSGFYFYFRHLGRKQLNYFSSVLLSTKDSVNTSYRTDSSLIQTNNEEYLQGFSVQNIFYVVAFNKENKLLVIIKF